VFWGRHFPRVNFLERKSRAKPCPRVFSRRFAGFSYPPPRTPLGDCTVLLYHFLFLICYPFVNLSLFLNICLLPFFILYSFRARNWGKEDTLHEDIAGVQPSDVVREAERRVVCVEVDEVDRVHVTGSHRHHLKNRLRKHEERGKGEKREREREGGGEGKKGGYLEHSVITRR
jgi:hypothetical protein